MEQMVMLEDDCGSTSFSFDEEEKCVLVNLNLEACNSINKDQIGLVIEYLTNCYEKLGGHTNELFLHNKLADHIDEWVVSVINNDGGYFFESDADESIATEVTVGTLRKLLDY